MAHADDKSNGIISEFSNKEAADWTGLQPYGVTVGGAMAGGRRQGRRQDT